VPASLIILEHVRPKYACAGCAAHVVIAARLPEPIEQGLPGTGLLAHVISSKLKSRSPARASPSLESIPGEKHFRPA
jgi:transposase